MGRVRGGTRCHGGADAASRLGWAVMPLQGPSSGSRSGGWRTSGAGESGCVMSLPIRGGTEAPRLARSGVLSRLEGRLNDQTASDVALVVSELVSNSVLHAHVGADQTMII